MLISGKPRKKEFFVGQELLALVSGKIAIVLFLANISESMDQ